MNYRPITPLMVILSLILFLFPGTAQSITSPHDRNVVTAYSPNLQYKAISVPYSSITESRWGKTDVYDNRTSNLLYTIPDCMVEGHLLISDDGSTVAHIINNAYHSKDTSAYITHEIDLYHNGKVFRRFTLDELFQCDRCENFLLFNAREVEYIGAGEYIYTFSHRTSPLEKFVSDHPIFFYHDTAFIYTSTYKLIKLNILTGQFTEADFNTFTLEQLSAMPTIMRTEERFKNADEYASLRNNPEGCSVESALATALKMKADKNEMNKYGTYNHERYKYYPIHAWLRISRKGEVTIIQLNNRGHLPDTELRNAIMSLGYQFPSTLPDEIDNWYQEITASIRKSNNKVAAKERKLEKQCEKEELKKRWEADTINGFYIPRNIEECFHQLDTLLCASDRNTIRNYSNREETIDLHLGLGMWLRNNWGLWAGSRLQTYLFKRGLKHPDDMSATILEFYWDYLHGINEQWKAFDAKKGK